MRCRCRQIRTLLSLATASEMDVLKSSGLFWASVVMRLVAAVTTPWKRVSTLKQDALPHAAPILKCAKQHALTHSPHRMQRHIKTDWQRTKARTRNSRDVNLHAFDRQRLVLTLLCKHNKGFLDKGYLCVNAIWTESRSMSINTYCVFVPYFLI